MEIPPDSPGYSSDISESQEGSLHESQKHSAIFSLFSLQLNGFLARPQDQELGERLGLSSVKMK